MWVRYLFAVSCLVFTCVPEVKADQGLAHKGKEIILVNGSSVVSISREEINLLPVASMDRIHFLADTYPYLNQSGGLKGFMKQRIVYPGEALLNQTEGVVMVSFVVDTLGLISKARILRGVGNGCDEEVLRLLQQVPAMEPATIAGKPVRAAVTLPVRFKIEKP